jgi:prepilin-type N-terminal cleavage/methylation domain-containing protein
MKTRSQKNQIFWSKAAFTLTELLVTIVIIVVLAAMSFLGFSKMRAAGDRIGATRSLAQIQLANAAYATEHNGAYMPIEIFDDKGSSFVPWYESTKFLSYLKGDESVYYPNGEVNTTLPLNMLDPVAVRAKKNLFDDMSASFGYMTNEVPNRGWGVPNSQGSFRMSQLTSPARSAVFMTATDWNVNYWSRFAWKGAGAVEGRTGNQKIAYRHSGKALVGYYDGHIGEVSMGDIRKIDTKGGSKNIFWKGDAN